MRRLCRFARLCRLRRGCVRSAQVVSLREVVRFQRVERLWRVVSLREVVSASRGCALLAGVESRSYTAAEPPQPHEVPKLLALRAITSPTATSPRQRATLPLHSSHHPRLRALLRQRRHHRTKCHHFANGDITHALRASELCASGGCRV